MSKAKIFAANAVIMTAAALLMRAVGLAFNVFVSNRLGGAGMGLFSLIMTVYGFASTLAVSGVNLASTRLTAEGLGMKDEEYISSSMRKCVIYSFAFGSAASFLLTVLSKPIGLYIINDERAVGALYALALSLPFVSLSSALGGYFNARRKVTRNVSGQIFGQLARIMVTAILLSAAAPDVFKKDPCFSVCLGASVSEGLYCLYMIILYRLEGNKKSRVENKEITPKLLNIALPTAFSSYVRSGLLSLEHMLIPRGLSKSGASGEAAVASYGVLCGMVMPVVLFPMALLSSFAGLLVPELSEEKAGGGKKRIDHIITKISEITLIYSVGCAGITVFLSGPLGDCLYGSTEASKYIAAMAPLIPVMYFDHVTDGMLKGLGEQLYTMRVNIADSIFSCIMVWLILPHSGIVGYIFIIFAAEILNTSFSVGRLISIAGIKVNLIKRLFLPMLCIMASCTCVHFITVFTHVAEGSSYFDIAVKIIMSSALYVTLLAVSKGLTKEDLAWVRKIFASKSKKGL